MEEEEKNKMKIWQALATEEWRADESERRIAQPCRGISMISAGDQESAESDDREEIKVW